MPGSDWCSHRRGKYIMKVFSNWLHRLLDVVEVLVFRQLVKLTARSFSVRPFFDFRHPFAGNQ
ncbi:hypothetical protein DMI70_21975 [Escherichia coli]|nr:hypothetical protein [Escherichia coli]